MARGPAHGRPLRGLRPRHQGADDEEATRLLLLGVRAHAHRLVTHACIRVAGQFLSLHDYPAPVPGVVLVEYTLNGLLNRQAVVDRRSS